MKIGYFCNSTNWGNKKEYNQILKEAREIAIFCDKNGWEGGDIWRAGGLLASHEAEHCGSFLPAASIPRC